MADKDSWWKKEDDKTKDKDSWFKSDEEILKEKRIDNDSWWRCNSGIYR